MREARINLPVYDNAGRPLGEVANELERKLCEAFGGFTATAGHGGWVNPDGKLYNEPVTVYDIAMVPAPDKHDALIGIAGWAREAAKQEAIYVRDASGEVHFV